MLRLLDRLAVERPVLLVIEDLHWADRSTRDLLAFLWRNARGERLCIVGTFRSDELHRRHPLTAWLAEAERQPHVERLDLVRFEQRDLIDLLTGILGAPPTPTLLESIARRSDGNAFFAEELVAASDRPPAPASTCRTRSAACSSFGWRRPGTRLPISSRWRPSPDARSSHDVLAEVCGVSDADLATAVREAVDAQLLVVDRTAESSATGSATHSSRKRPTTSCCRRSGAASTRRMRGRWRPPVPGGGGAEASRLVGDGPPLDRGPRPGRALPAAIAAGDASRAVFAYGEASRQYELAIELWDLADPADLPAGPRSGRAVRCRQRVGEPRRRRVARRRPCAARARTRRRGVARPADADRERARSARERLGNAAWLAGDTATSIQALEEAVDAARRDAASTTRARVLAGLAANLMLAARASESIGFAARRWRWRGRSATRPSNRER